MRLSKENPKIHMLDKDYTREDFFKKFKVVNIKVFWTMGIHYTFGANKGSRLMEKKAKRERKLAEKRAKKQAKSGFVKKKEEDKTIPLDQVITLDMLTDPDKKKMDKKDKKSKLEIALKKNLKKRKIFQKKQKNKKN